MRFACLITKCTNTQSEYVTLIALRHQQRFRQRTSMLSSTHIVSLLVNLIDAWTKTPLPAAQVNSWSNSLHITTCSGEPNSILWIS